MAQNHGLELLEFNISIIAYNTNEDKIDFISYSDRLINVIVNN